MAKTAQIEEPDAILSRDVFRTWADRQPHWRFERHDGIVVAMAPERAAHNLRKSAARDELLRGVRAAGLPCQVFADGMTIEVGESDYVPDAVLRCGPRLPGDAVAVPDPLVIVEVLSPSTSATDRGHKLAAYFRLPCLRHYLIVWPDTRRVVHHRRLSGGGLATETFAQGEIWLDPPGIGFGLDALYAD